VKNRIHLDLVADDFGVAVARATELGATPAGDMHEDRLTCFGCPTCARPSPEVRLMARVIEQG
jgi:hypothetical protein